MFHSVMKTANSFVSLVIGLALLLAGAYAGYCLWDNQQIYSAAENVQAELLRLKPKAGGEDENAGPTFDELLKVNSNVRGWVSLDGTKIDYPVLQGKSNIDYLNTDIYGNFALAGSIFLDARNDSSFNDAYSVLYGHHMEKSAMFGDLDKYLDRAFFDANSTGELMVPGKTYNLKVISVLQTSASEDRIFEPDTWKYNVGGLLNFAKRNGLFCRTDEINGLVKKINQGGKVQILALTTCSSDFTNARTIVLTVMTPAGKTESGEVKQ